MHFASQPPFQQLAVVVQPQLRTSSELGHATRQASVSHGAPLDLEMAVERVNFLAWRDTHCKDNHHPHQPIPMVVGMSVIYALGVSPNQKDPFDR